MTNAPTKPPIDDPDGNEPKEAAPEFVYGQKRPRNLLVIFSILVIVVLIAAGGLIKALSSDSEDPAQIKFPEHMTKSLSDEQPMEHGVAPAAQPAASVPYQTTGETEMLDQTEPVQQEETDQTESTLDLNSSATEAPTQEEIQQPVAPATNGDEKVDEKKTEAGPQSMIEWDHLPTVPRAEGRRPQIAIVIDDMGLNRRNSNAVSSMKTAFTLAYLPYAENLAQQTAAARQNGHELIVHMPMEPDDLKRNNPGPDALLMSNAPEENVRRLDKNLASFTGYIGINNHMGSRMTADASQITPILRDLKQRGLWFLDSRTIGNSVAGKIAGQLGVPYVVRDVFLDNVASVPAILQQLRQAEAIAKKRGYAVAIGHPHDATIAALKQWAPTIEAKGFELVSLSTIIAERFPNADVPQYAMIKKTPHEVAIEPAAGNMTIPAFGMHAATLRSDQPQIR